MKSRFMCHLALWVVTMCVLLPESVAAQTVPEGAVEEAHRIFNSWLEKAKSDPAWFRDKWLLADTTSDFSEAMLEDPYALYMMHPQDFVAYLKSTDLDIMSIAKLFCYAFPAINRGRLIGSLLVVENKRSDGKKIIEESAEYIEGGGHCAGAKLDQRIRELRSLFQNERGYRVCGLTTTNMGDYVLVRREGRTEFISPCSLLSGKVLSVQGEIERGGTPVLPFEQAIPLLRQAAEHLRTFLEQQSDAE
jgi:hypothetical protein